MARTITREDAVFIVSGAGRQEPLNDHLLFRIIFSMPQARIEYQHSFVHLSNFMMTTFCHSLKALNQFNERMKLYNEKI